MVVLLPFADDGLSALEAKLDAQVLLKAVKETRTIKVEVTMPKFKVRKCKIFSDYESMHESQNQSMTVKDGKDLTLRMIFSFKKTITASLKRITAICK